MRLYHVSPTKNDSGIRRYGLLTGCSRCKEQVVWLMPRLALDWAIEHVRDRHAVADVTVWLVDVPREWTQRRGRIARICLYDIPARRILGRLAVTSAGESLLSNGQA